VSIELVVAMKVRYLDDQQLAKNVSLAPMFMSGSSVN
jgi:hypothetical protein